MHDEESHIIQILVVREYWMKKKLYWTRPSRVQYGFPESSCNCCILPSIYPQHHRTMSTIQLCVVLLLFDIILVTDIDQNLTRLQCSSYYLPGNTGVGWWSWRCCKCYRQIHLTFPRRAHLEWLEVLEKKKHIWNPRNLRPCHILCKNSLCDINRHSLSCVVLK